MVRPGRNWVQHKCDQLDNNCDGMLNHLKQMHELYTYGQDGTNKNVAVDHETGEVKTDPAYPKHAEQGENIIGLVLMLQKIIKQFKQDCV